MDPTLDKSADCPRIRPKSGFPLLCDPRCRPKTVSAIRAKPLLLQGVRGGSQNLYDFSIGDRVALTYTAPQQKFFLPDFGFDVGPLRSSERCGSDWISSGRSEIRAR